MSELLDLPQDCMEMSYVQNVDNMVSGADVRSTAFLFKSNGMPLVSTNGCDDARL